jgi:AhpD family alkylhydroperoxidase
MYLAWIVGYLRLRELRIRCGLVFLPAVLFATHIVVQKVTHEAMRGPSAWSVGDRRLMAAYVSKMNECEFCVKAHTAVAARAYHGEGKVSEALSDLETTAIEEPLRATLRLLGKLTREHVLDADDMLAVLAAGVSRGTDRRRARGVLSIQHDRPPGQ